MIRSASLAAEPGDLVIVSAHYRHELGPDEPPSGVVLRVDRGRRTCRILWSNGSVSAHNLTSPYMFRFDFRSAE